MENSQTHNDSERTKANAEVEVGKGINVGGRLQHFWQKWEARGANPVIVDWLKEGVKLDFSEKPIIHSAHSNGIIHGRSSKKGSIAKRSRRVSL